MKKTQEVTVHEAAEILSVSSDTIRRWAKKGLIKASRNNSNYRVFNIEELKRVQQKYSGNGIFHPFVVLKSPPTKFNVIELFSGCGGLALGFENAGLKTQLLIEIDKDAADTLKHNRPNWNVIQDDIKNVSFKKYRRKVDIVAGGFPCQAYSYAGKSLGFADTRGTLFFEFARCVKEVEPKIAVAENVRGLVKHDGGKTLKVMLIKLHELGYKTAYHVLRAQFLDVAQKRERLVIIGARSDLDMQAFYPREKDYTMSVGEALKKCPRSTGQQYPKRKKEIMEMVPPGGYWRDLPVDFQKEYMKKSFYLTGGRTGMARRLSWDEPSLTLTTSPAQKQTERCHPKHTRPLNIREYARIQSFPDEWKFMGAMTSQYRQIGNAVPVNLAYHLGRSLIGMLASKFDDATMLAKGLFLEIEEEAILVKDDSSKQLLLFK